MLQAILSRVHYNLMHPKTPMAIMPLVEEQIRRQRSKAAVPQQEWQMTERLKCQPDPPDLLLTIVQGLEQLPMIMSTIARLREAEDCNQSLPRGPVKHCGK